MSRFVCVALVCVVAACNPETSIRPDADPDTVVKTIECAGVTPDLVVMTAGLAYDPTPSQIKTGGVVQFVMPPQHNVSSATSGLAVAYGATTCLKFPTPGMYMFACATHGFMGSVLVTDP